MSNMLTVMERSTDHWSESHVWSFVFDGGNKLTAAFMCTQSQCCEEGSVCRCCSEDQCLSSHWWHVDHLEQNPQVTNEHLSCILMFLKTEAPEWISSDVCFEIDRMKISGIGLSGKNTEHLPGVTETLRFNLTSEVTHTLRFHWTRALLGFWKSLFRFVYKTTDLHRVRRRQNCCLLTDSSWGERQNLWRKKHQGQTGFCSNPELLTGERKASGTEKWM